MKRLTLLPWILLALLVGGLLLGKRGHRDTIGTAGPSYSIPYAAQERAR